MKTRSQSLGGWGEDLAASYLAGLGYTILERNVRTPYGEIDLIAHLEPVAYKMSSPRPSFSLPASTVTVFVEVKTRSTSAFGMPEASITPRKKAHLLSAIQAYIQAHPDIQGDWRVDVIAIRRSLPGKPAEIIHFENALS